GGASVQWRARTARARYVTLRGYHGLARRHVATAGRAVLPLVIHRLPRALPVLSQVPVIDRLRFRREHQPDIDLLTPYEVVELIVRRGFRPAHIFYLKPIHRPNRVDPHALAVAQRDAQ